MSEISSRNGEQDDLAFLDEPAEAELTFKFASIPPLEEIHVYIPPMRIDGAGSVSYFVEHTSCKKNLVSARDLDTCFFVPDTELMETNQRATQVLPKGFYCNEFLQLNPLNIEEFLDFQNKYGRVVGARKRMPYDANLVESLRPEPDADIFLGSREFRHKEQLLGIKSSQALFDSVQDTLYLDPCMVNRLGAVSFREAIATTLDAQDAIKKLLRIKKDDCDAITKRDVIHAKDSQEYVALILGKAIPFFELTTTQSRKYKEFRNLIDAVFMQLVRGLLNNDAYRVCANPECRRTFTPREMNRRSDTKYCCSACQEKAKRLRYINKHSK